MTAMELAHTNGANPAMENVLKDMLSVMDIATVNLIMTAIFTLVKAQENAKGSIDNAMEPVLMKEPSVEIACASVVMMILTVIITA